MKVIIEKSLELIILLRLLEQGMIIVIRATTFGYKKGGSIKVHNIGNVNIVVTNVL